MTSSFREIFALAGLALAVLVPVRVEAQAYSYPPHDVYLLPLYCKYTQGFRQNVPGGNNSKEIERHLRLYGSTFNHMHHYCWGLMESNRAMFSKSRQDRIYNLKSSIGNFDYVIQRAPSGFVLLPEILTKKGENLIQLGRGSEALVDLQRAIRIKPDYGPAYAAMSDYFNQTGQLAKARESLEKGLSVSPNTKALQQRLSELNAPQSKHTSKSPAPAGR